MSPYIRTSFVLEEPNLSGQPLSADLHREETEVWSVLQAATA